MFARLGCVLLLLTATASAQEYGRSSSGELRMFTGQPSKLSASLGFNFGAGKGFEGSLGGTLIEDRMWFFASAMRDESPLRDRLKPVATEGVRDVPAVRTGFSLSVTPNSFFTVRLSKSN